MGRMCKLNQKAWNWTFVIIFATCRRKL